MLVDVFRTPDSESFFVYDIDNDCLIENCTWADDKTGVYSIIVIDKNKRIVLEGGVPKKEIKQANIKLLHRKCLSHLEILKRLNPSFKEVF